MKKPLLLILASSFLLGALSSCSVGKSYAVSFSSGAGYSISGESKAKEGQDYVFTVTCSEGYEATSSFAVKANDVILSQNGGKYVVSNVTSDLSITVEGVEKIAYSVSFLSSQSVTFQGEASVSYGESYSFKAEAKEGYEGSPAVFYSMGGGEASLLTSAGGGIYSVPAVKGNLVISSEELKLKTFSVSSPEASDKYVFSGPSSATYGQDYVFSLEAKEGYDFSSVGAYESETTVKDAVSLGKNRYKIEGVKGDLRLFVNGVGTKVFAINKDFVLDHYDFKGNEKVSYGEDYTFELSLKDGYQKGKEYGILVNGEDPEKTSDGKYIIRNVTSAPRIEAFGEETITLNVTFSCSIPSALKKASDRIPYFQDEYRFRLELGERYSQSQETCSVFLVVGESKTALTEDITGIYAVDNPHADFTILVEGVSLNSYPVRFYYGDAFVYEAKVNDGSTLTAEQLSEAEKAFEAVLGEDEKFDEWDQDLSSISEAVTVHGSVKKGIGDEAGLRSMESDGSYYLKNDIVISSVLNLPSFSGRLDGQGHCISSADTGDKLLQSGETSSGVLFSSFSGTLKDLDLEIAIGYYSLSCSGIAASMEDGLIQNVSVSILYQTELTSPCGGFVGTLKGGTVKDSSVRYVSQSYDNTSEGSKARYSFPLAGIISGGSFQNVTAIVPGEADLSKLLLAGEGMNESTVVSCLAKKEGSKKNDSAIVNSSSTEETYFGMPLNEGNYSNGASGTALFQAFSLNDEKIDRISFFVKMKNYAYDATSTKGTFDLEGGGTLRLTNSVFNGTDYDVWNYVELKQTSKNVYRVTIAPFYYFAMEKNGIYLASYVRTKTVGDGATLQSLCGHFYSWNASSSLTLLSTPLYVTEK